MSNDIDYTNNPNPRRGKALAGSILLIVGVVFLLREFDYLFFPDWLFDWPMWLIVWGLYIGAKHNFRNSSGIIMIVIGVAFLLRDNVQAFRVHDIVWPVIIMCFGLWMIFRRNHKWDKNDWKNYGKDKWWVNHPFDKPAGPMVDYTVPDPSASASTATPPPADPSTPGFRPAADDYLDAVSVFGGVKKTILSKNFKGGEIVNVFGGAELDFTQANINGHVVIDITQIFGGTKIVVPSHWRVVPDMAAVFASVDDKRIRTSAPADSDKVLVLKGVSIFAGVDIRSY